MGELIITHFYIVTFQQSQMSDLTGEAKVAARDAESAKSWFETANPLLPVVAVREA